MYHRVQPRLRQIRFSSWGVAMAHDLKLVTEQGGSPGTAQPDPLPTAENPRTASLPPVVLFLPGLSALPCNTSARLADVMCADLTRGAGTYAVRSLDAPGPALTDGRRIVAGNEQPLMDLYTVPYRDRLPETATTGDKPGVWALVKLLITQVAYFGQALRLLLNARNRAKTPMAKWQLVVGFGTVVALLGAVVVTIVAIVAALGLVTLPNASGTFADAFAIGATGVTTWALAKATPVIREAASRAQQMMDYAESQQQAVEVANSLGEAIDAVLESAETTRPVFILGYSMGALVAFDYLCPRTSQLALTDDRHVDAIRALITIGSPLDFVRLYLPQYVASRQPRVQGLPWTNVFIPADVLGSNCTDENDYIVPAPDQMIEVCSGMKPTRIVKFTDERLTWSGIRARRGFLSHGDYWSVPGAGNCLSVVLCTVRDSGAGCARLTPRSGQTVTEIAT
jgi:pimeloyl-ACP methyl ester carboxylesterase